MVGDQAGRGAVLHRRRRRLRQARELGSPFAPYGWPGVMAAAAVVFFAYIGFDAVSTTAEEAKNPQRDLPIGIIASLVVCTVLYLAVVVVLLGHRAGHAYRSVAALPGYRSRRRSAVPQRARRLRAQRDRPGLGRLPGVGWRRRRDHPRAAGHAHEPAAHLLRDEPRRAAAAGRQQGAPAVRHALHHDHHHVRDRGDRRRPDADPDRRRDDQHRDAVRVRHRLRAVLILRVKRPEAHRPFRVAWRPGVPGARHPVVRST